MRPGLRNRVLAARSIALLLVGACTQDRVPTSPGQPPAPSLVTRSVITPAPLTGASHIERCEGKKDKKTARRCECRREPSDHKEGGRRAGHDDRDERKHERHVGHCAALGHIVIVLEENTDYINSVGSMPWLDQMAAQYGLATQYYAVTHPSIGNYLMLATGQIITDDNSYTSVVTVDNIIRRLNAAGQTWKGYAEDLPYAGDIELNVDNGTYASRHFPLVYLSDVRSDPNVAQKIVPFTQFATDLKNGTLPNFSFVTPNLCNDAHHCSVGVADSWLKNNIAPLLANSQFQEDGLLIVTFDESFGPDTTHGGGRVEWVAVGPSVKRGYQSSRTYQHQSTLRLILKSLGITSYPGAAATAPDMTEFFTPSASGSPSTDP